MAEFYIKPLTHLLLQQPHMQKQNLPCIYTQRTTAQNPIHTNLTTGQSWHLPNQQPLWYEPDAIQR